MTEMDRRSDHEGAQRFKERRDAHLRDAAALGHVRAKARIAELKARSKSKGRGGPRPKQALTGSSGALWTHLWPKA